MADANARLEAFSDGVFAIALTLLIIDVKLPGGDYRTNEAIWRALGGLAPTLFAFVLSFAIILITWVNHHATLKLITRSSASFVYANGFLLLTVVLVPFPASLLGQFLGSSHPAPAVVLYNATLAAQAVGWILMDGAAIGSGLAANEKGLATLVEGRRNGYVAFLLYAALAVLAFWLPRTSALVTAITWAFWLMLSIRLKRMAD